MSSESTPFEVVRNPMSSDDQQFALKQSLATSELGTEGASDSLLESLLQASGMSRDNFSEAQTQLMSERLSAFSRTLLREAAVAPQAFQVATERLNVRVAPNMNASIVRKLPRGATVSVVGSFTTPSGEIWRELSQDSSGGIEHLLLKKRSGETIVVSTGVGWICQRNPRSK
eukprot:COSAG06_NODE_22942_length_708_cov_0.816092_1_plen_171_part_10